MDYYQTWYVREALTIAPHTSWRGSKKHHMPQPVCGVVVYGDNSSNNEYEYAIMVRMSHGPLPITWNRMVSMYEQGYSYKTIAIETGYNAQVIALLLDAAGTERLVSEEAPCTVSKYDHMFNEPVCAGRPYKEYLK